MHREGVSRMLHIIDNYYAQTNNYGYLKIGERMGNLKIMNDEQQLRFA